MGTVNTQDPTALGQALGVDPSLLAQLTTGGGWSSSDPTTWTMPSATSTGKNDAESWFYDFYNQRPGDLSGLKQKLFNGGFYTDTIKSVDQIDQGFDDDTYTAWKRAVSRTAAMTHAGQTTTLDDVIAGSARASAAASRAAIPRMLTHPDDIKTAAMKVSTDVLGQGWNDAQLNNFTKTFQQMELSAQQAGTANPSLSTEATLAARKSNPVAASATDSINAYGKMLQAIKQLETTG